MIKPKTKSLAATPGPTKIISGKSIRINLLKGVGIFISGSAFEVGVGATGGVGGAGLSTVTVILSVAVLFMMS